MDDMFFEETHIISFYECDRYNNLKLEHLMRYISDISGVAYLKIHGYNHKKLWNDGFVFVLTSMSFFVYNIPKKEDKIRIKTWEQGVKGVKFYRNYQILNEQGEISIEAQTTWVLINPVTRKIVKPKDFTHGFMTSNKELEKAATQTFNLPENMKILTQRKINYSDIDPNNHLYNAIYGRIICDMLGYEYLDKPIERFDITFNKEALYNDVIKLSINYGEGIAFIRGDILKDKSFTSRITFKKGRI